MVSKNAKSSFTVLTRRAQRVPEAAAQLSHILRGQMDHLAEPAIEVAAETGDPIGRVLAEELKERPRPELALKLVERLPAQSIALREFGVIATQQALTALRRAQKPW